jgi:ATP-dependent Clp protease ATP-binding subunit ClpC
MKNSMFESFTEKAIKVIMLSHEEAHRLGHNFVGNELILVGLVGEGTGIAAKVLRSMGVDLTNARTEVEKIIGRGSGYMAIEIPFEPQAKRVLEFARSESDKLGHNYIGTEHLLLGLIEGESIATRVLETLGVDLTKIRPQVIRMLGETTEVMITPKFSNVTIQQLEAILLLKSIENKTMQIDRIVTELKQDIADLRRRMM